MKVEGYKSDSGVDNRIPRKKKGEERRAALARSSQSFTHVSQRKRL